MGGSIGRFDGRRRWGGDVVHAISKFGDRIVRYPFLFVVVFVALYGCKREDFSDFAILTQNPFVTHPVPARQFLHSSPLTLFIGWPLTEAVGPHAAYTIVCGLGFALLLVALRLYGRDKSAEQRRVMVFVVASTPILLVLTRWLGKGDPYLLAFFLMVMTYRDRRLPSAIFSLLLVLSHKELGTLMLAGDALLRWNLRWPIMLGVVLGNAAVMLYLSMLSVPPLSRIDLALDFLGLGIEGWKSNPLAHLFLAFGWFWMILIARGRTPDWPRVALTVALCFAVSLDGADYTRDFILCAFPVVLYTAEAVAGTPNLHRFVVERPFPFLFLAQMQIESFDQLRDSSWLLRLLH